MTILFLENFYYTMVKILNFNFSGCTFLHFIEKKLKVRYRFQKKFKGFIKINNKKKKISLEKLY